MNEQRDMNNRIKLSVDDITINNEDRSVEANKHDCSIAVIEYPDGYDEGEELDLEVWYEGTDYKIPSNALRLAAQLLEIAEFKGVINT